MLIHRQGQRPFFIIKRADYHKKLPHMMRQFFMHIYYSQNSLFPVLGLSAVRSSIMAV